MSGSKLITEKPSKDETYWKVLNTALTLDFRKGHLKWSMSELSRQSKVTRSLIYYYFGKSKESILEAALDLIGQEFLGLSEQRLELWQTGDIIASVTRTRKMVDLNPDVGIFYLVHCQKEGPLGDICRKLEKAYIQKIRKYFPKAPDSKIYSFIALVYGLVFVPSVPESAIPSSVEWALASLK